MNTSHHPTPYIQLLAVLIALAAFALAAAASRGTFERLPHLEDEFAYLYQARMLARGDLTMPTPEPRQSYWQPFIIDRDGARFGKYPPGWPLLLAVGVLAGMPWIVNALLAMLTTALTYRLGRELFGPAAGVIAAALVAASPILILLSGSLMAHTAAAWWGLLLLYAIRRLARHERARWAVIGGLALGMLVNTRPLTAVGIMLPLLIGGAVYLLHGAWRLVAPRHNRDYLRHILRSGPLAWRIIRSGITLWWRGQQHKTTLAALLLIVAGTVSLLTPLHNAAATGDPAANLYTLVWDYDRVGFGPEVGRSGHTLEKARLNAERDLALWRADLFGWAFGAGANGSTAWQPGFGLSWLLLPLGLIAHRRERWAWLLIGTFAGLVLVHLAYWIGAQVYSARYYAEATPALAIVAAAGVSALARRTRPALIYALLTAALLASLVAYTPARLAVLYRHNDVGADDLAALEALRDGRPVLVLVTGEDRRPWRDWGTFMAVTSPYLDGDIAAARDHNPDERAAILARFPDRQVIELLPDGSLAAWPLSN